MKKQTLARVYIDRNDLMISFQPVRNFSFIGNKFIQYKTAEEKKYHSDWINSGDLINAEFTGELEYRFDLEFRHLNLDLSSHRHTYISENEASDTIKQLQAFKRLKAKYYDKLSDIGISEHGSSIEVLLTVIFDLLNVVGATVSTHDLKKSFGSNSRDSIINLIADLYRSKAA